jgi:hypothetical protein
MHSETRLEICCPIGNKDLNSPILKALGKLSSFLRYMAGIFSFQENIKGTVTII